MEISTQLTPEALKMLDDNDELKLAIAKALNIRFGSVERQIDRKSFKRLTAPAVLEIISKHLGKTIEEITCKAEAKC